MKGMWSDHFAAADKPSEESSPPCKTHGLWSEIFPSADESTPPPPPHHETCSAAVEPPPLSRYEMFSPAAPPLPRYERCLICPKCNAASCRLLTSSTTQNPGRRFYICPAPANNHKFFKWADEVKPHELIDVPYCGGCMAGVCRVRKVTNGPNSGRILFRCRIKEGEGSCGYKVWKDELEVSSTTQADVRTCSFRSTLSNSNSSTSPVSIDQIDEVADYDSPVIDNSPSNTIEQLQSDKPSGSLRRANKRSRYGDLEAHSLTIRLEILDQWRNARSDMNSVSIEHCWKKAAVRQNLSSELLGWWGRLAFHPKPCLSTHPSKPFARYVSSPLESSSAVEDGTLVNSGDSITLTRNLLGFEPPLLNPDQENELSRIKPICVTPNTKPDNFMSKSISKAFSEAAEHLQNDLLTLLENMDVKEHEAMTEAAEATFAALDRLLINHQEFKKRANEFIHCAMLLSEIEQSMPENDSYQKLAEHCTAEKTRLDEINCVHTEVVDNVTSSKKRLKLAQEEISSTMDLLFQIEAELSCCEVELKNMEHELEKISEKKEVLEGNYTIASKELESSLKLREKKEADRNAAKAAFNTARALLRG
ncbi:hypothetical protein ABFS82_01G060100 [Erythranthe guttata]|uniref:uncharacterized protein LOC105973813 n=1 Tax=Erythranthe guttata TaxID=4155 RepID=UPI00064DE632|nr:PREDICTED: uncharacterized protein LOC105973813 [Erythranthe guttata]|eukprot:XP_012854319.1 PREDICTED: uncharacterized protein LOC105973813 [Erythranthe guttata]